MLLHHQLQNRVEIRGTLKLLTGLHIGTALQHGTTNASVIRDAFGKPFIPGSSLKGAFRSRVETMAHALVSDQVCLLQKTDERLIKEEGGNQPFHEVKRCLSTYRDGAKVIQMLAAPRKDQQALPDLADFLKDHLCPACQLFGGASWRSKLSFDDIQLVAGTFANPEIRDGVGLDRFSRTAVDGVKYDFEALPAHTKFAFRCSAENLDDETDWPLFAAGLLELCHGHLPLGGKVTRGLGAVELDRDSIEVYTTDFNDAAAVLNFFKEGQSAPAAQNGYTFLKDKLKKHPQGVA